MSSQLVKAREGLPEGYMILGQFQQSQQGLGLWHSASVTDPKMMGPKGKGDRNGLKDGHFWYATYLKLT